jgi:phosphate transport system permease protein
MAVAASRADEERRSSAASPLRRRRRGSSAVWVALGALASALAPMLLIVLLTVLLVSAWPSVVWNGLDFVTRSVWSLGNLYGGTPEVRHGYSAAAGAAYGALPFIAGTLLSSLLALVVAVPVGLGVAICLAERARGRIARVLGFFVELIAGVPSVVFGLWGFVTVVPWVEHRAGPGIARVLGFIPFFRGPILSGQGLLAAALVLAAMVLPLVAAVGRDALVRVPREVREQGRALGLTDWETLRDLVLPAAAPGLLGGVMLALGRALGETMAVLMVSGTGSLVPHSLFSPTTTMASAIVIDLDSAFTDASGMAVHALAEVAAVLLVITVLVNLAVPFIGQGASRVAALLNAAGRES